MAKAIEISRRSAAKRTLKTIERFNKTYKANHPTGYWLEGNYQAIVNGYIGAYLFENHYIDGIPQNENNECGLKEFSGIVEKAERESTLEITSFVPTIRDIKEYEKQVNSKTSCYKDHQLKGIPIFIGDDFVNTDLLMNIMGMLPNARFYVDPERMTRPILLRSEYGIGVLLPIHPIGAVDGKGLFMANYPYTNLPKNPENVFYNESLTRYTKEAAV